MRRSCCALVLVGLLVAGCVSSDPVSVLQVAAPIAKPMAATVPPPLPSPSPGAPAPAASAFQEPRIVSADEISGQGNDRVAIYDMPAPPVIDIQDNRAALMQGLLTETQ